MKVKFKNYTINMLIIFLLLLIIFHKKTINEVVISNSLLFIKVILPSLLPIIIITKILIKYDLGSLIPKKINYYFNKIFKLDGPVIFIYLIAFISGIPSFSIFLHDLVKNKLITKNTYQKLNYYLYLHNPLFIYYALKNIFTNNTLILIILFTPYLMGLIYPLLSKNNVKLLENKTSYHDENIYLETGKTLLTIYVIIVFFGIICSLLTLYLKNNILKALVFGTLEMTNGLNILSSIKINELIKIILTIYFINFGGLSIIFQMKNVIKNDIYYPKFLLYRLITGIVTIFICFITKIHGIW